MYIVHIYMCFIKTYKHFSLKPLLLGEQCCSLEIDTIQFTFSECHPPRLRLTGGRPESDKGQQDKHIR